MWHIMHEGGIWGSERQQEAQRIVPSFLHIAQETGKRRSKIMVLILMSM